MAYLEARDEEVDDRGLLEDLALQLLRYSQLRGPEEGLVGRLDITGDCTNNVPKDVVHQIDHFPDDFHVAVLNLNGRLMRNMIRPPVFVKGRY